MERGGIQRVAVNLGNMFINKGYEVFYFVELYDILTNCRKTNKATHFVGIALKEAESSEFIKKSQIKSRTRVANHGEVFTAEREVKAMCDLVKDECERIESRFLEPACGNGNFLTEVLARKLESVKRIYEKSKSDFEQYSFLALTSIYGVELLSDNASECRKRLFAQYKDFYEKTTKSSLPTKLESAVNFVLEKNILCGNALSLKKVDDNQKDTAEAIIFSEWSFVKPGMIKRREFRLDVLLAKEDVQKQSFDLFDDSPFGQDYWMPDPITKELIPKPIKEYPIVNFLEVEKAE